MSLAEELDHTMFAGFSPNALKTLCEHDWPGNVRELKNVVERAVYRCNEGEPVSEIILDPFESPYRPKQPRKSSTGETKLSSTEFPLDMKQTVQQLEYDLVVESLEKARHSQKKAAELLGLTYHQLRHYMKKYQIEI